MNDLTQEVAEWIEAFDEVIVSKGPEQGAQLLQALRQRAREAGVSTPGETVTPYLNTIPKHEEVSYPGDRNLEDRVEALIRWNAMAMVHGQNKKDAGIGGHISTYSSLATLLEVGFNHFFHATYPGTAKVTSPATSFTSRVTHRQVCMRVPISKAALTTIVCFTSGMNCAASTRHSRPIRIPWLMPDFWRFPTVSMGIGPLNAVYQARFMRYLENRKLIEKDTAEGVGIRWRWRDG